jgi:Lar family restriction alleviation protein
VRKGAGKTQEWVADLLGLGRSTITGIENGHISLRLEDALTLTRSLGVSMAVFDSREPAPEAESDIEMISIRLGELEFECDLPSDIATRIYEKVINLVNQAYGEAYTDAKPCPFCGDNGEATKAVKVSDGSGRWFVCCDGCGADGAFRIEKSEAIAAWNRRDNKALIAAEAEVERLKALVDKRNDQINTDRGRNLALTEKVKQLCTMIDPNNMIAWDRTVAERDTLRAKVEAVREWLEDNERVFRNTPMSKKYQPEVLMELYQEGIDIIATPYAKTEEG